MPGHDVTFNAQWTINNYTIKFITDCSKTFEDIVVTYNTTIPNLPDERNMTKKGHKFECWSIDDKCFEMAFMLDYNVTLYAKWNKTKEEQLKHTVTITFSKADITREEIEEEMLNIVEEGKYFEITEEDGELVVIISYDEIEEAEKFVRNVEEDNLLGSRVKNISIKRPNTASTLYLSAVLPLFFCYLLSN